MSLPTVAWVQRRKEGKKNFARALRNRDSWLERVRMREHVAATADHTDILEEGDDEQYMERFEDSEAPEGASPDLRKLGVTLLALGVGLILVSQLT
jgi:hypothetical protein